MESGPIAGVQWFVTAPKHTPTICSQLPCHYYTFTFLLPMPSTVQLPLTSLEVLFMDQVVTFYIFSSFKPQAQKSSYSSSNFQIVSSNLRLLVVQSCCFFQPGLQIENSSCHVRDDFHWHFAAEETTVHFGVAFRKSCPPQEFVGDLPYGLSGLSPLRTKAPLSLCSLPGDISSER